MILIISVLKLWRYIKLCVSALIIAKIFTEIEKAFLESCNKEIWKGLLNGLSDLTSYKNFIEYVKLV